MYTNCLYVHTKMSAIFCPFYKYGLLFRLLEKPFKHKLFTTATRGIIVINEHGVKESSEVVLKRFRRLGNGLWIHHQVTITYAQ